MVNYCGDCLWYATVGGAEGYCVQGPVPKRGRQWPRRHYRSRACRDYERRETGSGGADVYADFDPQM